MKIEAISVSVDYGDFLSHSALWAKSQFDRWIVVTASHDRRTRDICEHHHIECVVTDAFYDNDRAFTKSAGINFGLQHLDLDGWVAHFDADIVLPGRAREMIENATLDPLSIWGCDRLLCQSYEDWCRYVTWPEVQHSCQTFIQANDFPLGPRVGKLEVGDGWYPIGFFQLWNPGESGITSYLDHGTAGRSDTAFALQWPRGRRGLIPEFVAIHLASEPDQMGQNWRGRRSPHFGPSPHPRKSHDHHRHHHHGHY